MTILSPKDVSAIDINSSWLGVSTRLLMENAGNAVASIIKEKYPASSYRDVAIVCGTGNNGGDGFVVARHLASYGYNVHVLLLGDESKIRSIDARENFEILKKMFLSVKVHIIKDSSEIPLLRDILKDKKIVVDAILGVGSRGKPRGLYGEAIKAINEEKENIGFKIVSIDVPSGFDSFKGKPTELTIKADATITFVGTKKGLIEDFAGTIYIVNIGQPPEAIHMAGPGDLIYILGKRKPNSHKGDFGRIMIIGGSKYFYGAPALTGLAALKTGADLAFIYAPEPAANSIKNFSPDLIVRSLNGEFLSTDHLDFLISEAEKMDVIAIGPGLGVDDHVIEATHKLISELANRGKKLVIDADGLKALARKGMVKGNIILTPHAGEFKQLSGISLTGEVKEDIHKVKEFSGKNEVTVLLKSHIDIIADGDRYKFNITGNPGMTVGGTGDVLTGIVSALYAITDDPFKAACAGAFISGSAGDLAFERRGYSLTATDVLEEIPRVIKKYILV